MVEPATLPGTVQVKAPVGAEQRACKMLLPELEQAGHWSDVRIAVTHAPARVLAAAAVAPGLDPDGIRHSSILLRVAKPFRRQGIGSRLLEHLEAEARQRNAASLRITFDPFAEPDTVHFLKAQGFECVDRFLTFESDTQQLMDYLFPLKDWLQARGDIPTSARVVPLIETDLEKVARLHVDHLGGTFAGVLTHLKHLITGPSHFHNAVLLAHNEPEGLILCQNHNGLTQVQSRVVSPAYQGSAFNPGWANVLLMAEVLGYAHLVGSHRCRFSCLCSNGHTLKLATRCKAETVATQEVHRRTLTQLVSSLTVGTAIS